MTHYLKGLACVLIIAAGPFIILWTLLVLAQAANAQGPCCPPGQSCPTPGYGGWAGVGIPGPYGGGVGVRAAPGRGVQVGVGGPYGGVVGAQVGGGRGVAVGVLPGPVPYTPRESVRATLSPATVKIESSTVGGLTRLGTGTLVVVGPRWHILTAAHILTPGATPQALVNGRWVPMRIVATDALNDVALLARLDPRRMDASAMPILSRTPSEARWQGYAEGTRPVSGGGRVSSLWAELDSESAEMIAVPGKAPEGTSGGPIYTREGLVSVITEANNGPGYWVTCGPRPEWLAAWVQTAYAADQGTEQPGVADPSGPPIFPDGPSPYVGPHPGDPVVVDTVCRDQFDAAIEALKARDKQLLDRLMVHSKAIAALQIQIDAGGSVGPPGPPGPPGADAEPCTHKDVDRDELRAIVREEIEGAIVNRPPADNTFSHAVLIRDAAAEYWPRLREELIRAQGAMAGIEESDPPPFATPLPRFVVYQDGTPIYDISGLRDVGDVLRRVSRGEFALTHEE